MENLKRNIISFIMIKKKNNNLINNKILTNSITEKEIIFLKFGRYLLENVVERGGLENVFKGKDLETDKIVIIKQCIKN